MSSALKGLEYLSEKVKTSRKFRKKIKTKMHLL